MPKIFPRIFCAIDTNDLDHVCDLVEQIAPVTGGIKLGLEFFNHFGPRGVELVLSVAPDASLFLDLKFHDIPNTVAGAVRAICSNFSPAYLNVHAGGGSEMMKAAKEACGKNTKLLGVTVLTSLDEANLKDIGYARGLSEQVSYFAGQAEAAGLDGIVCSAHEIENLRSERGEGFVLMVPGIRPEGAAKGDQKRVMTPKAALEAGATHLVIGRPITQADDPSKAAKDILESL
ncbi:MAG: orotidine-5'-phosphate decarboxylase [Alphaproteobacteria bacterium]|nr:orotidine-5'-phosphate decarboxylase [Alphaproteobacteria bacterium]